MQDNRFTSGGGLSSLASWIGYGCSADTIALRASLLPRSSAVMSHSPYFSFFALQLEEYYTQTQTQVWDELLKLLHATSGKANVDNCLKVRLISRFVSDYLFFFYLLVRKCNFVVESLFKFKNYLFRVSLISDLQMVSVCFRITCRSSNSTAVLATVFPFVSVQASGVWFLIRFIHTYLIVIINFRYYKKPLLKVHSNVHFHLFQEYK